MNYKDHFAEDTVKREKVDLPETMIAAELKMLKENYHNQGEYDWEDETYLEFKKIDKKRLSIANPKRWIISFLCLIGKCGTDPWSILAFIVGSVILLNFPITKRKRKRDAI